MAKGKERTIPEATELIGESLKILVKADEPEVSPLKTITMRNA